MKDLVTLIAKRLADKPEAVSVEESEDGVLNLVCDEGDKGKLIGKQGKVIKAIRDLAGAAAQKAGRRVSVQID